MNLENQFDDYLAYQEAVKEALIPNYKSDWPEEVESDDSSDDSSDDEDE